MRALVLVHAWVSLPELECSGDFARLRRVLVEHARAGFPLDEEVGFSGWGSGGTRLFL